MPTTRGRDWAVLMEEGIEITASILRAGEDEIVPRIGMLGDLEGLLDMSGTSTTAVSERVLWSGIGLA